MKEQYDGLLFHPRQQNRLYNTTLTVYFMDYLSSHGVEPVDSELIDPNVLPSESVLNIVSKIPLTHKVIDDLYATGTPGGVFQNQPVSTTISTKEMLDLMRTSEHHVLSLLYCMGLLTQGPLPEGKRSGTMYRVPNEVTRKKFADVLRSCMKDEFEGCGRFD